MDIYSLVDYFVVFAGAYMIYLTIQMKRTGEIRQNGLLSKNIDLNKAPDPAGFIRVMTPWYLIFGAAIALSGAVSIYIDRYNGPKVVSMVTYLVMFAAVIVFAYVLMRAQKKYLQK